MSASRFIAFYDAVLAIIMTIIVLGLEVPSPVTIETLIPLLPSIGCYALSFFWLGLMWISTNSAWNRIEQVSTRTLLIMLVSLFFCSFFPYTVSMVGRSVSSRLAEMIYGLDTLLITLSNIALSRSLNQDHPEPVNKMLFMIDRRHTLIDLAIKAAGLILCLLVWPPAVLWSVVLAVAVTSLNFFSACRREDRPSFRTDRK